MPSIMWDIEHDHIGRTTEQRSRDKRFTVAHPTPGCPARWYLYDGEEIYDRYWSLQAAIDGAVMILWREQH